MNAAPAAGPTILVVEDEDLVRNLVCRMLELRGYRVLAAASSEEALNVAAAHAGPIDLLLSDVVLPRLGGRELAVRLREARPALRVLFISGYGDEIAGELGPRDAFLQKPFASEALHRALQALAADSRP
ncbi:MAG: response regulator [Acidobacteria bacterium]|nr:response regulator [Acidobacteriota bacterium]